MPQFSILLRPLIGAACLAAVVACPAQGALQLSHITDAQLGTQMPDIVCVAEGRIGDRGGAATFELDLGATTSAPEVQRQYGWVSDQVEPFSLVYDNHTGRISFTLGGNTLQYTPLRAFNTIAVRTRASFANSDIHMTEMLLDAEGVSDSSISVGPASDILLIKGGILADGFTFTGKARLHWTGSPPSQSNLAFQLKVGSVKLVTPQPATTWGRVRKLYR